MAALVLPSTCRHASAYDQALHALLSEPDGISGTLAGKLLRRPYALIRQALLALPCTGSVLCRADQTLKRANTSSFDQQVHNIDR